MVLHLVVTTVKVLAWLLPIALFAVFAYGCSKVTRTAYPAVRDFSFRRQYVQPLEGALTKGMRLGRRSVRVELTKAAIAELKRGEDGARPQAFIHLPPDWPAFQKDKENVLELTRAKLENSMIALRWDMLGDRCTASMYVPPLPPLRVSFEQGKENFSSAVPFLGLSASREDEQ